MLGLAPPLGAYTNGKDLVYVFLRADSVHGIRTDPKGEPVRSLSADLPLYEWHDSNGIPPALTAQGKGVNVAVAVRRPGFAERASNGSPR